MFDGKIIEWVKESKYLELNTMSNMSFACHIDKISSRISCFSGVFYNLNRILPKWFLIMLYLAFILPHLTLHIEIWGAAPECHIKKIIQIQNQLLRDILNVRFVNGMPAIRADNMYKSIDILTVNNL